MLRYEVPACLVTLQHIQFTITIHSHPLQLNASSRRTDLNRKVLQRLVLGQMRMFCCTQQHALEAARLMITYFQEQHTCSASFSERRCCWVAGRQTDLGEATARRIRGIKHFSSLSPPSLISSPKQHAYSREVIAYSKKVFTTADAVIFIIF